MAVQDETVSFSLEVNVEKAYEEIRKLQTVLYRTLSLMSRLGMPEDVEKGIALAQRLIATINALRLAIIALQTASGPIGWALALVGLAGAGASYVDTIEMGMRTH